MPWLRSKRQRTRCLWSCLVFIVFITCGIFVYVSLEYTGKYCEKISRCPRSTSMQPAKFTGDKCISTCISEACIFSAKLLISNMNASADPCEDFYSFSCGSYLDKFGKDDNYTVIKRTMDSVNLELKELLDNLEADPGSATGKMKTVYDSCIQYGPSEHRAIPSALEFLRKIGIPNWPNLSPDFEFTDPNLPTLLGNLAAYKEYAFIKIENSYKNSSSGPIYNASVTRGRSFFEGSEESVSEYLVYLILKYFNIQDERANKMWEEIRNINNVLKGFNKYSAIRKCKRQNTDSIYINCSEDEDSKWEILCQTIKAFVDVANISNLVSENEALIPCADNMFFNVIYSSLGNMSHRSIADFLAMNFFLSHLEDLSFYFRLTKQKDPRSHDEYEPISINRYERCIEWMARNMVMALAYEYTSKFVTKSVLIEIRDLIEEYIKEIGDLISHQNWLMDSGKAHITHKINQMTTSVNLQIEFYLNKTYVENYYKEYHPTSESFLKNILLLQKAYFSTEMLERQRNDILHRLEPFTANAYFDGNLLEIGLPNLRLPLYFHGQSKLINLMSVVLIVGHEIGHSVFSDLISMARGNRTLAENFLSRISCFVNQYSKYPIETIGRYVHADSSLAENMPDNIGITLLDRFIEKYVKSDDIYSLPSLPYSAKQLIYITASQFWCSKTSKERDASRYIVNPHIPEHLRIIGMLHNSKLFPKVFNCPEGSYMNPSSKCTFLD